MDELIEAQEVIEGRLAAPAAGRASAEQLEKRQTAAKRMEAVAANAVQDFDADVEFHLALAEAAGNRYSEGARRGLAEIVTRNRRLPLGVYALASKTAAAS